MRPSYLPNSIVDRLHACGVVIGVSAYVVASPAQAAGKIDYGSRVGMQVTVRSVSGIGSANASIKVEHTPADAREFCVQYSEDKSPECVERTLRETRLNDELTGNCQTGRFVTLYGERLRFVGENRKRREIGSPKYIILGEDGRPLDGSSASGYPVSLGQFAALCPNRADAGNGE